MPEIKKKVVHLTSVHKDNDIRIFLKECVSLSDFCYDTSLIIPNVETRKELGVNIISFNHKPSTRLGRMIGTVNKVYKLAKAEDADIYHMHDPELLRIAKKLKRLGKKVIYDTHEDLPRSIMSKTYVPLFIRKLVANVTEHYENRICKKLDGIVTATPFINERFININPNSVNINNFPLTSEFSMDLPEGIREKKVCYIGGIEKIRGIVEMIDAIGIVEIPFQIGGAWTESLKLEMSERKGWKYVSDLGFISRDEANQIKTTSTAGLLTFLPEPNHINAQPNKMFEYMAAGLPVIASNFDLWVEILEKNNTGICVDPSKPQEIAKAIQFLLDNPDKAKEMGENGRKLVKEKFNWEIEKIKLFDFYSQILN